MSRKFKHALPVFLLTAVVPVIPALAFCTAPDSPSLACKQSGCAVSRPEPGSSGALPSPASTPSATTPDARPRRP